MLKLGIIGTNAISEQFVGAGQIAETFNVTAIYSRTEEKAEQFAKKTDVAGAKYFTDTDAFFNSDVFDVVYIASPNSFHFRHALQAIEAKKDVIVEKPAFSNPNEFSQIEAALQENPEVMFFEAARHIYDPNFKVVEDQMAKLDKIEGATISYMKYSSRYDNVLAGERPNVFTLDFSGGALQDLGVYTVYVALKLFGVPEKVHYFAQKVSTGVDGRGTAVLEYPDFNVNLIFGKIAQSYIPSEIYGGHDTIWIDNIGQMDEVRYYPDYKTDNYEDLSVDHPENPLVDESIFFEKMITDQDFDTMQEQLVLAHNVNQVVYALRQDAGIVFAADGR